MKYIDVQNWSRKRQFENFINYTNPIVSITTKINVSNIVSFCKENKTSFFSTLLYIVSSGINDIKEFRLRLFEDKVVLFETVNPSYVVLCDSMELKTCYTNYTDDFDEFCKRTRNDIRQAKTDNNADRYNNDIIDCIYISDLPWFTFSSITNPYDLSNKSQSSIPRINWGKYYPENGDYYIDFSVSVNHALADGFHIAALLKHIEASISDINDFIKD